MNSIKYSKEMADLRVKGLKTQTRRPVKFSKDFFSMEAEGFCLDSDNKWFAWGITIGNNGREQWQEQCYASYNAMACPYGEVGHDLMAILDVKEPFPLASNILGCDKITGIRIERVQNITEEDCIKEGLNNGNPCEEQSMELCSECQECSRKFAFYELWNSFYGETEYSWDKNPWVWVIDFEVTK